MKIRTVTLIFTVVSASSLHVCNASLAVPLDANAVKKRKIAIHNQLLEICKAQGDQKKVKKEYVSLIALEPTSSKLRYQYGLYLSQTGKYKSALTQLKKASLIDPANKDILGVMGTTYLKLEDYPNALKAFRKAIQLGGKRYVKSYESAAKIVEYRKKQEAYKRKQEEYKRQLKQRAKQQKQNDNDDW